MIKLGKNSPLTFIENTIKNLLKEALMGKIYQKAIRRVL